MVTEKRRKSALDAWLIFSCPSKDWVACNVSWRSKNLELQMKTSIYSASQYFDPASPVHTHLGMQIERPQRMSTQVNPSYLYEEASGYCFELQYIPKDEAVTYKPEGGNPHNILCSGEIPTGNVLERWHNRWNICREHEAYSGNRADDIRAKRSSSCAGCFVVREYKTSTYLRKT